jgi:hypothetical protein
MSDDAYKARLGAHYDRYQQPNYAESNVNRFANNDFSNVYTSKFNEQLSTQQELDIEYENTNYYMTVSSKDRDTSRYTNVNRYVINFPTEFRNVSSIQLIQAIIPHKNSVDAEPYLLLKVEELEDVMVSLDRNVSDAFAILQMSAPVTTNGFIQIDKRIHENTIKHYKTPKATLSKMTITVTDHAGTPFEFGSDSNPPSKALQNTFVFKITCIEKKRKTLNIRGIF